MHASSVHFSVTGKPAGKEQQGFISTQGFGTDEAIGIFDFL